MKEAHVIGCGLSGLATAWHLADHGFTVTVSDAAAGPGGLIQTRQSAHGLVETAANAFVWTDTVAEWFDRLDLAPVFARDESKRRYIYRDGRPRRWPLSIGESAGLAARLGAATMSLALAARDGETMAAWGDRVLGGAARQWLLEPAMQGIYATPASALSARAIFSGRRKGPRRMVAPRGGMGEFATRLAARLVERGVRFQFNTTVEELDADRPAAICTSAPAASRLLAPHAPVLAARIAAVRVAPLVSITNFYVPHGADVRGFGVLFPEAAGIRALGVLFNADVFDGRGRFRSETWIIGDRSGNLTAGPDAALHQLLAEDRAALTGRQDEPVATHITRWPVAVPVYDDAIIDVTAALAGLPSWIALGGNYLGRIGVAALLDHAADAAARIDAHARPAA
jgi:oxygen-dependent protoporphyrinogen oxidase